MKVSVDFETRSPVDLKKQGAFVYFEHPDTKILIAAYRIDGQPIRVWTYDQPPPEDLFAAIEAGAEIHAYNAQFESLGFDLMAGRHGWPRPKLEQFRDTAAAGAALALPRRLEDLAVALGLDVQKDKDGARLIRLFSVPRRPLKTEAPGLYWHEPEDHKADFEKFKAYCARDVETEEAAARRMVPLSDDEQAEWVLNQRMNRRGIRIDLVSAHAALRLADKAKATLDRDMKRATGGAVTACSQVARLTEWIVSRGVPIDGLAKADIIDLLDADDLPADVRAALELRQEAAKTSVSKLNAMIAGANADGRVRGTGIYHGASTGREQSTRINFNNLPRPRKAFESAMEAGQIVRKDLFADIRREDPDWLPFIYGPQLGRPLHLISDSLRSFIWAAPGYDLLQADYSGIEGAVAAWVADENWKVAAMHEIIADPSLPDMYRRTAAAIMNTTTEVVTKKHPYRQSVGKVPELALGFGGGVMAFVSMARAYQVDLGEVSAPVLEVADKEAREKSQWKFASYSKRKLYGTADLPPDVWVACDLIKVGWREANSAIAQAWHDLEDAVRLAIREPGRQVDVLGGRVAYRVVNGFLWCRLPSGRCLAYATPRLRAQVKARIRLPGGEWSDPEIMPQDEAEKLARKGLAKIEDSAMPSPTFAGVDKSGKKLVRQPLYGGLVFENVVQAIARDLLVSGKRKAEALGYPVIFTVYDEIVTEVPHGFGDLAAFEAAICELPEWAKTGPLPLPLTAGGWRGKRYRKD